MLEFKIGRILFFGIDQFEAANLGGAAFLTPLPLHACLLDLYTASISERVSSLVVK
jgi:hypothetical protein